MATVEKIRQVQLVGRKIRQLRKEHKLTQMELSARLGIQQSDLSRMEQVVQSYVSQKKFMNSGGRAF